jgi:hypothetical protein
MHMISHQAIPVHLKAAAELVSIQQCEKLVLILLVLKNLLPVDASQHYMINL